MSVILAQRKCTAIEIELGLAGFSDPKISIARKRSAVRDINMRFAPTEYGELCTLIL
jgi:hypothetical protein